MQKEDFRIGNLVLDEDGKVLPILSIGKDDIVYHTEHIFSAIFTLRGVPLTREWFIKLGFEIQDDTPFYKSVARRNGFNLFFDKGVWNYSIGERRIVVEYIHQLQNLFFTIFAEEIN